MKKWKLASRPNDLDLIFTGEKGGPIDHTAMLRKHFWPALDKAELPRNRFRDLRHTYASLLIDQGEGIKYIQKQMGHSKATVTLDIYAHLITKDNPEFARRLESTIFGTGHNLVTQVKKKAPKKALTT